MVAYEVYKDNAAYCIRIFGGFKMRKMNDSSKIAKMLGMQLKYGRETLFALSSAGMAEELGVSVDAYEAAETGHPGAELDVFIRMWQKTGVIEEVIRHSIPANDVIARISSLPFDPTTSEP